jgi:hypothetical protein
MDATVWCCKICISNLCRPEKDIKMSPPALANLLWLGREDPLCKRATMGARLLSCLGRPVWRKLILGKGSHDESEKGIAGNFIFLAQASLSEVSITLPPRTEEIQESFVVLFSRSIDDVKKARALIVHRDDYLALIRLRKKVCQVYSDVQLNEEQVRRFPEQGVPQELLECAQHLPEAENVNVAHVGPASRKGDMACEAHGAAKPIGKDDADDADWEEVDTTTAEAVQLTETEQETMKFETNTAEDVIAVDHSNDPGIHETFAAFQTKLQAVNAAATRVMAAEQQLFSQTEVGASKPDADVEKPDDLTAVNAACAIAAEKEECRTLILETQELAKKLTAAERKKRDTAFLEQDQACISTSSQPLSMLHPDTWSKCFVDFFYGDAVPNMELRGLAGNKTVHVEINDLFTWLQDREELEYAYLI